MNKLLDIDSYKVSHWKQFPKGTKSTFAYIESRGGLFEETLFFGVQYILKEILETPITMEMVEEAKIIFSKHFGRDDIFNYDGFKYIVEEYNGYFPLRIRGVEEGSLIKTSNVLLTIESIDEKLFWLPSWIETQILRLWYPVTVATLSYNIKKIIYKFNKLSSDDEKDLMFKLHDFGSRGVSSDKSAEIGSSAHLVNFYGTDTVNSIPFIKKYYGDDVLCYSIPASEHSTITSWTKEHEKEAYENMFEQFGSNENDFFQKKKCENENEKVFAVVSDSYDIYNAVANIWPQIIKEKTNEKTKNKTKIIIRPDSGDPVKVILKLLIILDVKLGSTYNSLGYKIINNDVRLIQGDGININTVDEILKTITNEFIEQKILEELKIYLPEFSSSEFLSNFRGKYSSDNVNFGMGSCLLQRINRDTQKFAMKVSSINVNDIHYDVFKQPIDDPGKQSKKGRLDLINDNGTIKTIKLDDTQIYHEKSVMKTYYDYSKNSSTPIIKNLVSFKEIREKADKLFKSEKSEKLFKKIGFFGGTFDPITKAHLKLIEISLQKDYDELHIVPVLQHTDKTNIKFTYYDRVKMTKMCLEKNIDEKLLNKLKVNEIERVYYENECKKPENEFKEKINYDTYDIIKEFKKTNKNCLIYLILGNDTYQDLINKKWSNSDNLLKEVIPITFDENEIKEISEIRSSNYKKTLDKSYLTDEINHYIENNDFI